MIMRLYEGEENFPSKETPTDSEVDTKEKQDNPEEEKEHEEKVGGEGYEDTEGIGADDNNFGDPLLIPTGLGSDKDFDILQSVLGQMAEGIWENSPAVAKFWKYANIVRDTDEYGPQICIEIVTPKYWENGFRGKTITEVKSYFAEKLRGLARKCIVDCGIGDWDRTCTTIIPYLGYEYRGQVTVREIYKIYDYLKGITDKIYDPPEKPIVDPQEGKLD